MRSPYNISSNKKCQKLLFYKGLRHFCFLKLLKTGLYSYNIKKSVFPDTDFMYNKNNKKTMETICIIQFFKTVHYLRV